MEFRLETPGERLAGTDGPQGVISGVRSFKTGHENM